jgi:hypothetical protein
MLHSFTRGQDALHVSLTKYTSGDLRYEMEQVIKKFVPKEGVGLKSV